MKVGSLLLVTALALTSCTSESQPAPSTTTSITPATDAPSAPITTAPPDAATPVWPSGTITCAAIEGNYPNGADDHNLLLDKGVLSFHRQPQGGEEWIQFVDDPTCSAESAAWQFMISNVIDAESLYRQALLCDFYERLTLAEPKALNARTVIDHLSAAQDLCA